MPYFAAEVSEAHLSHHNTRKCPLPAMVALVNLAESKITGGWASVHAHGRLSLLLMDMGRPSHCMCGVPSPSWDLALYGRRMAADSSKQPALSVPYSIVMWPAASSSSCFDSPHHDSLYLTLNYFNISCFAQGILLLKNAISLSSCRAVVHCYISGSCRWLARRWDWWGWKAGKRAWFLRCLDGICKRQYSYFPMWIFMVPLFSFGGIRQEVIVSWHIRFCCCWRYQEIGEAI